jgi:flavin-dependent dehydrogenase
MSVHDYDVVIVGARCAGAPLATLLARSGLRVAVLEQAVFPRDTLSSHVIQADAVRFLERLGVLPEVQATGARIMRAVDLRLEDVHVGGSYPGDGGAICVRRFVLDPILAAAAERAGAELWMGTRATSLVRVGGRVAGVRAVRDGQELELRARLVVGADGRRSLVAAEVGARRYHVLENTRAYYWSFFEHADQAGVPTFALHRWGDRFVFGGPADHDLYIVGISPEAGELEAFRRDLRGAFMDHVASCAPIAERLTAARMATKVFGIKRYTTYFRESAGPGWALLGDAGHFKDPAIGRGIGDAFAQAERLASAIAAGLGRGAAELDRGLRAYVRWRDRWSISHYWMGADIGTAGPLPAPVPEVARLMTGRGRLDELLDLFSHEAQVSEVYTVPRILEASGRLLLRHQARRALAGELGALALTQARRRWAERRPAFEPEVAS